MRKIDVLAREEAFQVGAWIGRHCSELLDPHPRAIALFGSFVRGETRLESDLDLLLVGDSIPQKPATRTHWVYPLIQAYNKAMTNEELSPSIPVSLAPLMMSERGWCESMGLRLSLTNECWILLDDGFLSSSLVEAAGWIRERVWNRETTKDGGWLWIPSSAGGATG